MDEEADDARREPVPSFLAVVTMAMLVPGPDTLVVLRTSLTSGPALGTRAAAGSSAGLLVGAPVPWPASPRC